MSVYVLDQLFKRTILVIYGYVIFNIFCSDVKNALQNCLLDFIQLADSL